MAGTKYTYDDEGNLVKKSKGVSAETWEFEYDTANQLVNVEKRATDGGTLQMAATYSYDALGNRIEKEVWDGSNTVTRFVFDRGLIVFELDSNSSLTSRFLLGDNVLQRYARITGAGAAWLLADRLGSIRDVVNAVGSLLSTIDTTGFGLILSETSAAASGNHLYAGYYFDRETGLYLPDQSKRGRIYNPETSQWLQEDPIRLNGNDYNFRRYVGNNAPNAIDPKGQEIFLYRSLQVEALPPLVNRNYYHVGVVLVNFGMRVATGAFGSDEKVFTEWVLFDGTGPGAAGASGRALGVSGTREYDLTPVRIPPQGTVDTRFEVDKPEQRIRSDYPTFDELFKNYPPHKRWQTGKDFKTELEAFNDVFRRLSQVRHYNAQNGPNSNTYAHQLLHLALKRLGLDIDNFPQPEDVPGWDYAGEYKYGGESVGPHPQKEAAGGRAAPLAFRR